GYGAALKTGVRTAKGDILGIIDADGTYPTEDVPRLLDHLTEGVEMVVGVRSGKAAAFPLLRRPGKAIVGTLAAFLVGRRIPDLNSGMRLMRRGLVEQFFHLLPDGFSFTTTITLAALTNKLGVRWVPIAYAPRLGTSTITLGRGLFQEFPNFLTLVVRIITYFRPLRFFMVPSAIFLILGMANLARTLLFEQNISDASILLIVVGIQIGLMGLLADLIVRSRG
ncbi:MAG: family 2 glycosyl transferase, partial [Parcubacteria group bacterium Gr01-1014_106]